MSEARPLGRLAAQARQALEPDDPKCPAEVAFVVGEIERLALEEHRADLQCRILDAIDLVSFAASLDPDEVGYGEPFAYSPAFRRLIHEAQTLESESG